MERHEYKELKHTRTLYVEEIDIMGCGMNHSPECQRVSHLSVEPDILVGWEKPSQLWTDDTNYVAEHRNKDQSAIKRKNETSAARGPD